MEGNNQTTSKVLKGKAEPLKLYSSAHVFTTPGKKLRESKRQRQNNQENKPVGKAREKVFLRQKL